LNEYSDFYAKSFIGKETNFSFRKQTIIAD